MKHTVKFYAASADKPAEILLHGPVGKSFWSDEGISGKDFTDALNKIPAGQKVTVGVNSQGGAVGEGLAIYNAIARRAADVTVRIDGYAISIASFIPLAASKVISPKSSIWMIHKAWTFGQGDSDALRKEADVLDTHDSVMAAGYARRTGMSEAKALAMMEEETWLSGEEAIAMKLADEEGADDNVTLEPLDFAAAGLRADQAQLIAAKLYAARLSPTASATKPPKNMTPPNHPADAQASAPVLPAKPDAAPAQVVNLAEFQALQNRVKVAEGIAAAERTARLTDEVLRIAAANPDIDPAKWTPRVLADETILADLRALPVQQTGTEPVRARGVINVGNPAIEAYRAIGPTLTLANGEIPSMSLAAAQKRIEHRQQHGAGLEAAIRKHLPQAANTISSSLKPDVLADGLIVVANNRLAAWRAFTTQFQLDPMRPMAVVQIKKATSGATSQTNPTNWETSGDSVLDPISITPGHKVHAFHVSQSDRNYGFKLENIAKVNANVFANTLSDVLTAVLTTANFGTPIAVGVAPTFQFDNLKPVLAAAKNYGTKILLLDGGHRAYLAPTDKQGFEFTGNGSQAFGFDGGLYEQNRWTGAATNACGFSCAPEAVGIASGPPENPQSGSFDSVSTFTIEDIGITVLMTMWYNTATRIQWASYELVVGAAAGDTTVGEVLVTS